MQTNWTQWMEQLGSELYHSSTAYQNLLPELADLQQRGREYRSSYKLNGEKRNRPEKTVILEAAPLVLIEHGDPAQNLPKYLMNRDHTSFIETVQRMAELVGMALPQGDGWEKWLERQIKKDMLATVQDYYQWCLHNAKPAAELEYLHSRFTPEQVKRMGLGYIPSKQQLVDYLQSKGYEAGQVAEFTDTLPTTVDSTHTITIPIYRAGSIYSFIYRHHNQYGTGRDKYKYHTGVVLKDMLQYIPSSLKKAPELVVVEGQLDCIHLLEQGIKNVVSTGTNHISPEQVEDAIKRGCRSFTLLYDADPTDTDPEKNSKHRTAAAHTIIDTAKQLGLADVVRVYIADLPQPDNTQKVDPSDYITENGAAAVQQLIDTAQRSWYYELVNIVNKVGGQQLAAKQLDSFNAAVMDIYEHITDPISREQYKNSVAQLMEINNPDGTATPIDPKAIEQMLADHQARKDKDTAQREAAQLMEQASRLMRDGQTDKALELQDKAAALLAGLEAEKEYQKLTHRTAREEIVAGLLQMPEAISTGLYLGDQKPENEILLPAGALSILAAPTSHGKTTMLVAMAVEAARNNPDKEYYLLSYEEAAEPIVLKAVSCYAGIELSESNRRTLQHYYTTGSWKYAYTDSTDRQQEYQRKEKEFFDMLEQGRLHLHYTDMVCENLCTNIRKLAATGKLGGVFIDYVQYLELAYSTRNYQRHEEISKICRMLKDAAVETGTPIILAAQFNRDVADPPTVSITNLGEGGDIERKAAYCLGFWNNDMPYQQSKNHKPDMAEISKLTKGNLYDPEHRKKNKSIYAVVLKNRSGVGAKAGTTGLLSFDGNIGTVGNLTQQPSTPQTSNGVKYITETI